jgi:hypothetical protein
LCWPNKFSNKTIWSFIARTIWMALNSVHVGTMWLLRFYKITLALNRRSFLQQLINRENSKYSIRAQAKKPKSARSFFWNYQIKTSVFNISKSFNKIKDKLVTPFLNRYQIRQFKLTSSIISSWNFSLVVAKNQ